MTKITTADQAERLYKAMVKRGQSTTLELIDYHYENYISVVPEMNYMLNIHDEEGKIVESYQVTMTSDAADTWLAGAF